MACKDIPKVSFLKKQRNDNEEFAWKISIEMELPCAHGCMNESTCNKICVYLLVNCINTVVVNRSTCITPVCWDSQITSTETVTCTGVGM